MAKDVAYAKKLCQRFEFLVKRHGSERSLAKAAGLQQRSLNSALRRESIPRTDVAAKLAQATGCSLRWLVSGEGEPFDDEQGTGAGLPILGTASAAGQTRVAITEHKYSGDIPLRSDLHAIQVRGDSMMPIAVNGQFVICTRERPEDGDLAAIELEDGEILFKRVYWQGKRLLCHSINPAPQYRPIVLKRTDWRRMYRVWGVKF